jgi:hypothetical protein
MNALRQIIGMMGGHAAPGGGSDFPEFIAAGSVFSTTSNTVSPVPPAHQENDILLVMVQSQSGENRPLGTASSGWTEITEQWHDVGGIEGAWYWKRAESNAESAPNITGFDFGTEFGVCYVIRGCVESGTPFEDATGRFGSNPMMTSEIDTTGPNRLVCSFGTLFNDDGIASYPPSGWDDESHLTDAAGSGAEFLVMSKEVASASTVTAASFGVPNTGFKSWATLTLAFIPA